MSQNQFPKLHNAMWPGLVGKGPDSEPPIDLDTMLELTSQAEVDGNKFEGVDIFLFDPHINIDSSDADLQRLADKIRARGLVIGSVVAPVWGPTGGGSAMGSPEERKKFVEQVRKGCRIAAKLRELGIRPYGVVRIDSACGVTDWAKDPEGNMKLIAQTFDEACDVAEEYGERLAAEGEICWGGMHSWKQMIQLLEMVNRPQTLGFQADMAHTLLYTLGYNAPEDAILPEGYDWQDRTLLKNALATLTVGLRPWTIDFHVAQNDATVRGSGSHDKTGRHCLATDPNGKLEIAHDAGYWLRDAAGNPTKAFRHICWDGCMFPNEVLMKQQTWNDILAAMVAVRDNHGWNEGQAQKTPLIDSFEVEVVTKKTTPAPPPRKPVKARATPVKKSPKKPVKKTAPKAKTKLKKMKKKATPKAKAKKSMPKRTKKAAKARGKRK